MPHILRTAGLLALIATIGIGLVAYTFRVTAPPIQQQEQQQLLRDFNALIPKSEYDNNLLSDVTTRREPITFGTSDTIKIYRARKQNKPVGLFLTATAPDGYNGAIKLAIGIYANGELAGVRVIAHKETPGLGDKIEIERHPWIEGFKNTSLKRPPPERWALKKDGGEFDQFSGASITPRAVVKAVRKVLDYYAQSKQSLFSNKGHLMDIDP